MKAIISTVCAIFCLLPILFFPGFYQPAVASDTPAAFVDLDGDGFHDFDADADNNGIPDRLERSSSPPIVAVENPGAAFFAELSATALIESHLTITQRFKLREFSVRDITNCRPDPVRTFDGAGSPGATLTGGGNRCVGGICF